MLLCSFCIPPPVVIGTKAPEPGREGGWGRRQMAQVRSNYCRVRGLIAWDLSTEL